MNEPLEIPESAFKPKPIFTTYPSRQVVDEIRAHVARTGSPQTYPGHTHTTPAKGANVVYVEEFDVPTFGRKVDRIAPCPCCTPRHPKYKQGGKIAWFPDEHVIRLIGPQCFKTLNAVGHAEAEKELRLRQAREKYHRYLIDHLPLLPEIIAVGRQMVEVAEAFDAFRETLLRRTRNTLNLRLWENTRFGELQVISRQREMRGTIEGQHQTKIVDTLKRYATIQGHDVLNPKATKIAPGLVKKVDRLDELDRELKTKRTVGDIDDFSLRRAAKTMADGRKAIESAIHDIGDQRRFVGPITVSTLRTWGALKNSTLHMSFRRSGRDLYIGHDPEHCVRIEIPAVMERVLPTLPHLAVE